MSGLWVLVTCITVLLVGTTGIRVIVYEVRQARKAKHVLHTSGQFSDNPPDNFYGSMWLDDERAWQVHHEWERREEQRETNWLTATMAELSPEALDSGPGADPPLAAAPGPVERLCGPEQPHEKPAGTESAGSGHLASHREDAQGRDVRVCATDSRPAAGADLTGSLSSRSPDEDPGPPAHGGPGLGPASLAIGFLPAPTRLADTGDITEAHENHPHPGEDWLDAQLADLYDWVRTQLEAA